jgi:hypothetical protein
LTSWEQEIVKDCSQPQLTALSIRVVAVLHDFLLTTLTGSVQKLKFGDAINNCRRHGPRLGSGRFA